MKLWTVEVWGAGMGIRTGSREAIIREEGTNNIKHLRAATVEDCEWVRTMGGYVPKGAIEQLKAEEYRRLLDAFNTATPGLV